MDIRTLQNGSDVRGIALEGVKGEEVNLTGENVYKISVGFIKWLKKKLNKDELLITLGRDSRLSGESLAENIMKGLNSVDGVKVIYFGLCTTPAMFKSCINEKTNADGAIMITASHLPFNRNGMKFFTKDSGAEKEDIKLPSRLSVQYHSRVDSSPVQGLVSAETEREETGISYQ